jgi:hypothetical protein
MTLPIPDKKELLDKCNNLSRKEAAAHFGVSSSAIRNWLKSYGIYEPRRNWNHNRMVDRDAARDAFQNGARTARALAEAVGCGQTAARSIMLELELDREPARANGFKQRERPDGVIWCRACHDPIDETDPIWGGKDGIHFTCELQQERKGTVIYHE